MKKYKCHKVVTAKPMNRLDYSVYRGWELPADENGADEGYLVEYVDGGKPNHPDHKSYISWSPKEQFDNGYAEVEPELTEDERVRLVALYPVLSYFKYYHLPPFLQELSKPFHDLAWSIPGDEKSFLEITECLRKLLESKDCAVRCILK